MKSANAMISHQKTVKIIKNSQHPSFYYQRLCENKARNTADILTGENQCYQRRKGGAGMIPHCFGAQTGVSSASHVVVHEEQSKLFLLQRTGKQPGLMAYNVFRRRT